MKMKLMIVGCALLVALQSLANIGSAIIDHVGYGYNFDPATHKATLTSVGRFSEASVSLDLPFKFDKDSVTSVVAIAAGTFSGIDALASNVLTHLTIPNSVKSIEKGAFEGCNEAVYDTTTIPGVKMIDGWVIEVSDPSFAESVPAAELAQLPGVRGVAYGAYAYELIDGVKWYYEQKDGESVITNVSSNVGDIVIPAELGGKPVTGWDVSLFRYAVGLRSVTIPATIRDFPNNAFEGCTDLRMVTFPVNPFPNPVIPPSAFKGSTALVKVRIPGWVTTIGASAFEGCTSLAELEFEESALPLEIGDAAFKDCTALEAVSLSPRRTVTLNDSVFENCSRMTELTFPDGGRVAVGGSAFRNCTALTTVTGFKCVEAIGASAFENCCTLTNVLFLADGCDSIGDGAFRDCVSLEFVKLPASLAYVGNSAFEGDVCLQEIELPKYVEYCGDAAFKGCQVLGKVVLPAKLSYLGDSAFEDCVCLPEVEIPGDVATLGDAAFKGCVVLTNVTLNVGNVDFGEEVFAGCISLRSIAIPSTAVHIEKSAFSGCSALEKVTLNEGLVNIDDEAFFECIALKEIVIPGTVARVGKNAFSGCMALESMTFEDGTVDADIDDGAFAGCINLGTADIRAHVVRIGESAFENCSSMNSLVLVDSIKSIGSQAFAGCSSLETFDIPKTVTYIGDDVIKGCSGLTSITIDGQTSIPDGAFEGFEKLTRVTIGASVTNIGDRAFARCIGLTSITIPGNVKIIGASAFEGCKNLTSVTIGYGVTYIGIRAFAQCTNLKTVTIPPSVVGIGNYAFAFCTNLQSANIPESLASEVDNHDVFFASSPAIGVDPKVVYYNPYDKARTWNGALRDAVGNVAGTMQVKVGRVSNGGSVKVSATATLVNGKKVMAKAKTIQLVGNGTAHDSLVFKEPVGGMDIDLNADGSPVIGNAAYELRLETVGGGWSGERLTFVLGDDFDLAVAGELQDQLLPWDDPFGVVGNKWKFAKNATVKLSKDKASVAVDASNGKTNLGSLKLTYTSKTGLFKGSFKAYALETAAAGKKKLKKYTVNVTGVVVGGKGYGQATCKKPAGGPWAVMVR